LLKCAVGLREGCGCGANDEVMALRREARKRGSFLAAVKLERIGPVSLESS